MKMTVEELEGCFKLLGAYYPGDWTDERHLVWAEAMKDSEFLHARDAIVELGKTEPFPSVALLVRILDNHRVDRIRATRGRHVPGSGWISDYVALEPGDPQYVSVPEELRARMRAAVRRVPE